MAFFLSIGVIGSLFAQKVITGTVTNKNDGSVIPGVDIVIKGTTRGTVTDFNGTYTLNVPANTKILQLSFGGWLQKVNEMLIGVYNAITKPNVYCPIFIMCGGM